MRVGYLVPEFPGQTHIFFWREILALRELGIDVTLVSTRRPAQITCRHAFALPASGETHYVYPPRLRSALLALLRRPLRTIRSICYVVTLAESSWRARLRYLGLLPCAADLLEFSRAQHLEHLHVHSFADAAHLTALCRILGGPPYSLTLHGDLEVYGTDHAKKVRRSNFVAAVGQHLAKQLEDRIGVAPDRCLVTFMGIDAAKFSPGRRRVPAADKLHLATVARLHPAKGHVHALAAVRMAVDAGCNVTYSIAGDGPHLDALTAEVERLGLGARVRFLGTQSEDEVLELLRSSDAFILPSIGTGEAWPVSVMEAMACGLPVICSIIGATPQIVSDGIDGFLVPRGDEPGLASAMVRLTRDVGLRDRMGTAARRAAVERFDCHTTARLLADRIAFATGRPPALTPVGTT